MYTGPDPITETEDGRYIHSYPKVHYPSDTPTLATQGTVVVQEKLDGGNFRVLLDENSRVYGSKKNLRGSDPADMNVFFRRPAKYIDETVSTDAQRAVHDKYGTLTIFGENMLYHSLDYDFESAPPFLVFDVWSHTYDKFLSLADARSVTQTLGLEFVPIIETLPASDFANLYTEQTLNTVGKAQQTADVLTSHLSYTPTREPCSPTGSFTSTFPYDIPESVYRDGQAEGVVFKNYDTQTFAKHVSPEFKEVNELRWGFSQKDKDSGEGLKNVDYTKYIVAKYVTDTRIEKQLRKLVMDQGELSMELTRDLIKAVYEDVWTEHGDDIIYSGETIDTDRLHTLVADRCRHRLKAIVRNRDMINDMENGVTDTEYLDLMYIG